MLAHSDAAYLAESIPLGLVVHQLLDLMDPLQTIQALIQQKGCVIHQHVHKPDKLST